eukprot:GFYU01000177.1.p1 GENE.GFYU01000177.1~~GFYU01000177.1.p1  ORF type:complete len:229 (-),score=50.94 GFYU01000177.1:227-817(-)
MGNKYSKAAVKEGQAKFGQRELSQLKQHFETLAACSPGKTIDQKTFLEYFPLPGLLGERLFKTFDVKRTGVIDWEEFVCGMALCTRGNRDDKIRFIFNIYDLAGDGAVSQEEMAKLLQSTVLSAFRILDVAVDDDNERFADEDEAMLLETVNGMVKDAFQTCDLTRNGKLSFDEFSKWANQNPEIIHMFDSLFSYI